MTHKTDVVARIMSIRNGMMVDADAEALIRDALDARQSSPETASVRDAFEAWATSDNRAIQPLQFEERTDDNNHYYESDHDNNAFIGWKAAGHAPTPDQLQMHADLRRLAIKEQHRLDGGRRILAGYGCRVCQGEWGEHAPEFHARTCTAAPAASPDTSTDRNGK
jgi:hypothetical protein